MKTNIYLGALAIIALSFASCTKSEDPSISIPEYHVGKTITGDTLSGSVKGTMQAGKTYYFSTPVTINAGDTLVMQSGVKLLALNPAAQLIVKGTFASLGTQINPNWITGLDAYKNPRNYKLNTLQNPNTDPGLKADGKLWGGIQCDVTCPLLDLKWTHLDFAGGTVSSTNPPSGYAPNDNLFVVFFQNPNGNLIIEDSWFYGSTTDCARINGGKIHIMRNTAEKIAYNDGDAFNAKNGTVGDMAFNLIVGPAKGGTKASNKGTYATSTICNVVMYNNTYISGGWRSKDPDRGANVNFEQDATGLGYNNIMVNCRTGLRVLENPAAGICHTGYNLSYGDSITVVNGIYPPTHATVPSDHDIPAPGTFYPGYPGSYTLGQTYNAPALIGQNNPNFVNFPLPVAGVMSLYNFVGSYNFHLANNSPAIGKGYTGFSPLNATSGVTDLFLKATVTMPNVDLGAFPTNGDGNRH